MVDKLTLPGFRFHPTDAELVLYYLKRKIQGRLSKSQAVISEVDIYKFAPWELPEKSCLQSKDLEWYFFCPRNNKYSHGNRTNRAATGIGYWKPTGQDRPVINKKQTVGKRRTLVFHTGKSPDGTRTDWVMHEFRIENSDELVNAGFKQDAYVLCKVFEKSGQGPRPGEQYGAPFNEEDWDDEVDTVISNDNSLPSALVIDSELLQSIASQAGELNSVHHVQNSSLIQPSSVGAETSLQVHFEVGESSRAQELSSMQCNLPPSFSDGVSLGSLTQENAHLVSEMPGSALPLENSIQYADLDFDLGDLGDLDTSIHHLMEPDDGFSVLEVLSYVDNQELQHSAEYANGDYLTVADIASENQANVMEQPPLTNVQDSLNVTSGDDCYDHIVNSLLTDNPQHTEMSDVFLPCIAYPDCQCCNNL